MNWARVQDLRREVGEDAFSEVVALFLEETESVAQTLRAPSPATPLTPGDLEDLMHFLKGAALNLGFDELARLCQTAEVDARTGTSAEIDITPILNAYDQSKSDLLAGLPRLGAVA
ncbi:Hpt domain-containing protein [Pseudoruegeria sp. SK021]|uniref:Hpt domain-containing protein n=1 Tax=Pseudoruegeria sp. SK021 TaxID=1933035 RepID=UPI000A24107E|nr:Hpt domain-containing protein [Pseudoruegeria sp. SK021]OSP54622.1 hypothetical protein BV911_11515 [Pseudoruegeria sp. SK021]